MSATTLNFSVTKQSSEAIKAKLLQEGYHYVEITEPMQPDLGKGYGAGFDDRRMKEITWQMVYCVEESCFVIGLKTIVEQAQPLIAAERLNRGR